MTEAEIKAAMNELVSMAKARDLHVTHAMIGVNNFSKATVRGWVMLRDRKDIDAEGDTFAEVATSLRNQLEAITPDKQRLDDILGISETWPPAPKEEAAA